MNPDNPRYANEYTVYVFQGDSFWKPVWTGFASSPVEILRLAAEAIGGAEHVMVRNHANDRIFMFDQEGWKLRHTV